jgi:hypothetical protein
MGPGLGAWAATAAATECTASEAEWVTRGLGASRARRPAASGRLRLSASEWN